MTRSQCPCCHHDLSKRPGYVQCRNCGWVESTCRQVMNPPADKAEAGNLVNAAPRQAEHDAPCRGETGASSCPEARPVTATEQTDLERLRHSDRKARTKLANMCETVMVRVVELEEMDSPPCKVIAKKLRAAVVAACD